MSQFSSTSASPWRKHVAPITPSDITELDPPARGLHVVSSGIVKIVAVDDEDDTGRIYTGIAGAFIPVVVKKVLAATTASVVGGI